MSRFLIKVHPQIDGYIEWSTIDNEPHDFGTREHFLDKGWDIWTLSKAHHLGSTGFDFFWDDAVSLVAAPEMYQGDMHLCRCFLFDLFVLNRTTGTRKVPTSWMGFTEGEAEKVCSEWHKK